MEQAISDDPLEHKSLGFKKILDKNKNPFGLLFTRKSKHGLYGAIIQNKILRPTSIACRYHHRRETIYRISLDHYAKGKLQKIDNVCIISSLWDGNFQHFITETLPRLLLCEKYWNDNKTTIFMRDTTFCREFVDLLNIKNIDFITDTTLILGKNIFVPFFITRNLELTKTLTYWLSILKRKFDLQLSTKEDIPAKTNIFLTRMVHKENTQKNRNIENEFEIYTSLKRYNFLKYCCENDKFKIRSKTFMGTTTLVTPLGANCMNILFCDPNVLKKVIFLLPPGLFEEFPLFFEELFRSIGYQFEATYVRGWRNKKISDSESPYGVSTKSLMVGLDLENRFNSKYYVGRPQQSIKELDHLFKLGNKLALEKGNINWIDIGAGSGAATVAFCNGVKISKPESLQNVYLVDRFVNDHPTYKDFTVGNHREKTDTFFEECWKNTREFLPYIIACDLRKPVPLPRANVIFLDCLKSIDIHKSVFKSIKENLTGPVYLIHQDFGRPNLPWIHYTTAFILERKEGQIYYGPIGSSLCLFLPNGMTKEASEAIYTDRFSEEEKLSLINNLSVLLSNYKNQKRYSWVFSLSSLYVRKQLHSLVQSDIDGYVKNYGKPHEAWLLNELQNSLNTTTTLSV